MILDNYDGHVDPKQHVQNIGNNLELIQDSYAMCKIFPITFRGSVHAWYNNLEPSFIASFSKLCTKLVVGFSTSIRARKISTKIFRITQVDGESTRTYLKSFNEKCSMFEN